MLGVADASAMGKYRLLDLDLECAMERGQGMRSSRSLYKIYRMLAIILEPAATFAMLVLFHCKATANTLLHRRLSSFLVAPPHRVQRLCICALHRVRKSLLAVCERL